jgi:Oxidoreductase molybdopterin binding domain.
MESKRVLIIGTVIFMCALLILDTGIFGLRSTRASSEETITFKGLFKEKTTLLSTSELKSLEKHYVSVTMIGSHKGYIGQYVYTGVPLKEAMLAAGYEGTRGENDSCEDFIRVIGKDGYGVVLSWGEVFNRMDGMDIILAYEKDGKPLGDAEGSIRLIVPGDYYCSRYVKGVVRIEALTGYRQAPSKK